ncbi:lipopolysaccharide biosynthesis protein [Immundisolibacter sp.]|uniref:lipopolysaccharide biosynthesis protein n=1 Tax=Immundisolibacter sp. TaxID=1934948 RepID=UPI00356A2006
MASIRKSLAISLTERYLITGVQLVSTMVLARLLSPHEIGVYSVATVFMGLIQAFRDMGVGQYLVQEAELTRDKIRTAAGAVLCTSWLLAPVVFFAAGPVAAFYREPGLADVLHVLALNLLLIPFGATVQAFLHRHMRFTPLLVIRLGSTVVQVTTGIVLAWSGYGFMSLAWASVAGVLATIVLVNFFRPPELRVLPSFRRMGNVFRFGGKAISMTLLTELSTGLPEMIVGRTLGMEPVGIYNRARGPLRLFSRLFSGSIFAVGMPHFARLHRESRPLLADYRRGAECVLGIAWPLFALMALFALPMVGVLYGPQWRESAALIPIMCLSASIGMMLPLSHELLIATGRVNRALGQVALQTALAAGVLVLASPYGLMALVRAAVALAVVIVLWRYFLLRGWALARGALPAMVARGCGVTAATAAGPLLVRLWLGPDPAQPLLALALAGALAVPGWLIGIALTGHPLAHEVARGAKRIAPRAPVAWMLRRVAAGG